MRTAVSRYGSALVRVGLGVALGLALLVVAWWIVFGIAPEYAKSKKDVGDARTNAVQLIGGAVLAVGAFFTARTYRLNRTGQITDRLTKAVEQLADEKRIEVRLGGIYALEQIAREGRAHQHPQVMEVLTAYVRERAPWPPKPGSTQSQFLAWGTWEPGSRPRPATDIRAALTVLGRRKRQYDDGQLDLRAADLRGAVLRGTHMECARLDGTHLEEADLVNAHLENAQLYQAHLEAAVLTEADLVSAS